MERNYQILEDTMISIMENRLEFGNELIDTELNLGALDFIVKPIIKAFYKYWQNNDAKTGTLIQIKTTLDCGKQIVLNGTISNDTFDLIVEQNFIKYLKGDQIYRQCSKNHENFSILKELSKEIFINRIKESIILLQIKEDVNDYHGLIRAAFKTKREAYETLIKQIDLTDQCIKIVEEDPQILKLPVGRTILIKTLRKGFDQTRKEFIDNLDIIYQ